MSVSQPLLAEEEAPRHKRCTATQTLLALLALQLGWGLWLLPHAFSLLGWIPALSAVTAIALTTIYSGSLFTRLFLAAPGTVLFGDIAEAAAGPGARTLCYVIVYTLDATRCVILHLAATQSLEHALGDAAPPLWQCGLIVLALAAAAAQVRALSELSDFFLLGTTSQLIGIAIVIYQLITEPDPDAKHSLFVKPGDGAGPDGEGGATVESQLVALFNIIFAYGGQFAFVELMTSMLRPARFPLAISACTGIMTALYVGLGATGYQSKGSAVSEIVIFSLGEGPAARVASACILVQALSQCEGLPCWFALTLLKDSLGRVERGACYAAIPLSLALSAAGLVCSVSTLIRQIKAGGSAFGPPV
ncbi:amino acid transporter [Raphidocelis subcapitata]|uniref:Amino acid transporter n=1 Tax=Raphidocelis subcapitata TaxID=307507 RepID=A0A2V0PAZ6_9CHLO|nr:amino acid transporter [Raphidocelis subcapitata]|eukprot:GBF97031.1 amino acid transporter [Raphidocelis subcapitata]